MATLAYIQEQDPSLTKRNSVLYIKICFPVVIFTLRD